MSVLAPQARLQSRTASRKTKWKAAMGSKAAAARAVLRALVGRSAWQRGRAARRQQSLRRCHDGCCGFVSGGSSVCFDDTVSSFFLTNPLIFRWRFATSATMNPKVSFHSRNTAKPRKAPPPNNSLTWRCNQHTQPHPATCNTVFSANEFDTRRGANARCLREVRAHYIPSSCVKGVIRFLLHALQ